MFIFIIIISPGWGQPVWDKALVRFLHGLDNHIHNRLILGCCRNVSCVTSDTFQEVTQRYLLILPAGKIRAGTEWMPERGASPGDMPRQAREWWLPRRQASKGRHTAVPTGDKEVMGPTSSGCHSKTIFCLSMQLHAGVFFQWGQQLFRILENTTLFPFVKRNQNAPKFQRKLSLTFPISSPLCLYFKSPTCK